MAQRCTVCAHAQRESIDRALIDGQPNRVIARQFAIGHDAVRRHAAGHLPQRLAESAAIVAAAVGPPEPRQGTASPAAVRAAERILEDVDILAELRRQVGYLSPITEALSRRAGTIQDTAYPLTEQNVLALQLLNKTSASLGRHLDRLTAIAETLASAQQVEIFQQGVLAALDEADPALKARAIEAIRRHRALTV